MNDQSSNPSDGPIAPNPLLVSATVVQGRARADVTFGDQTYRHAGLCAVNLKVATVASKDGPAEIPLEQLPPALRAEAGEWLAAQTQTSKGGGTHAD